MSRINLKAGNLVPLINGSLLIVKSHDTVWNDCYDCCCLIKTNQCTRGKTFFSNLKNVIENLEQYDLYASGCPLKNGLHFEVMKGGL